MDEKEEIQQNNMISNLPLLFASGYPTSLDKITASQLEKFIPFMVQCSLGHINLQGQFDCSEPEWWPEDIPFNIPFSKPRKFVGNWIEKLKEIVLICYQFHKSVFLLRFCNDLSSYEHASLRFINNYNSTTSLFDRRSNKLLVTFRNENMSYDQPQRLRKCLLQQKPKENHYNGPNALQQMVEPAPFDIYLCDNCDAELYSKEAILEHEKTCIVEDDDVILCENTESFNNSLSENIISEDNEQRIGFFSNFNLRYKNCKISSKTNLIYNNECKTTCGVSSESGKKESQFMIVDKKKRISRRNRAVHSVSRCPTIPLSSPAGQLLLRTTKTVLTSEYLIERLDRIERFCPAPLVSKFTSRPKFLEKKYSSIPPHCTFKKPQDYSSHLYIFPRRQFQQRRRSENILLINSTLLRRCRPISVRIKKISDLKNKQSLSCSNKLNIKLTRDNSRSSSWKISSCPSAEIIVDTIDLCTSDEEDNQITFCTSNFSYITRTGIVKNDENTNVENNSCISPLSIHTSLSQIRQQLNYAANSPPLINNSISKTCDSDSTFPQPSTEKSKNNSCFVHIVHKNDNLSNVLSINNNNNNKSDSSNGDISSNFIKPFRPSVYILSNGSTTALVSTQNINSESDGGSEIVNSATNLKSKSKNWLLSEHDLNIVSEFANSSCENSALASSHSLVEQDDRNRTLPLIVHQNHIVSIDLTS